MKKPPFYWGFLSYCITLTMTLTVQDPEVTIARNLTLPELTSVENSIPVVEPIRSGVEVSVNSVVELSQTVITTPLLL